MSTGADGDRWATLAGAVAAMLFAVHPMMTGAVGYVSGRSDLLSGMFMLLSLVTLRRWLNTDRSIWLVVVLATFFLALASKETAVILPALFLYYVLLVRRDPVADRRRHVLMLCVPLMAIAVVGAGVRIGLFVFVEQAGIAGWQWRFALTEVDVFVRYLAMMVAPVGQTIFHGVTITRSLLDPRAIVALGIVATYLTLMVIDARRRGIAAFGLVWFLLMLVPSALLILLNRGEAMVERRVYFASVGLFLAAGQGAASVAALRGSVSRVTRVLVAAVALVVIVGLAGRSVLRNYVWSSPVWLWAEAVERNPGYWYPLLLLGNSLHDAGRHDEAIQAFQGALRFGANVAEVYEDLGRCQVQEKRLDEAVVTFTALWTIHPRSTAATNGRATAALLRGQIDEARRGFMESLAVRPGQHPGAAGPRGGGDTARADSKTPGAVARRLRCASRESPSPRAWNTRQRRTEVKSVGAFCDTRIYARSHGRRQPHAARTTVGPMESVHARTPSRPP